MRIWAAATVLCREMLTRPSLVAGRNVLELGSGCGLCGLLAVKMGAATVCVSDFEASVLDNLRESVRLNTTDAPAPDAWDMGDVHVRYLSWGDDMERCRAGDLGGSEQEGEWPSVNNPSSAEAPSLSPDATYVDGFCAFCLMLVAASEPRPRLAFAMQLPSDHCQ